MKIAVNFASMYRGIGSGRYKRGEECGKGEKMQGGF
jgi:hypothetical protein